MKFTTGSTLPGGNVSAAFNAWRAELASWLPAPLLDRLSSAYGTRLERVLDGATSLKDLGRHFGADLYEKEVGYLLATEFARTADDILWRRTKLGLEMTKQEVRALQLWIDRQAPSPRGEGRGEG
jgi:glycerol-3-phosphate dehydrogenase